MEEWEDSAVKEVDSGCDSVESFNLKNLLINSDLDVFQKVYDF